MGQDDGTEGDRGKTARSVPEEGMGRDEYCPGGVWSGAVRGQEAEVWGVPRGGGVSVVQSQMVNDERCPIGYWSDCYHWSKRFPLSLFCSPPSITSGPLQPIDHIIELPQGQLPTMPMRIPRLQIPIPLRGSNHTPNHIHDRKHAQGNDPNEDEDVDELVVGPQTLCCRHADRLAVVGLRLPEVLHWVVLYCSDGWIGCSRWIIRMGQIVSPTSR